ncbi:cation:proton antiporter [Acholeplasma sp. OttesenSCG-928-E16]|nr:cation:proton antiporter [Acholeplasma sp. OttesenSCG-928-E16]
MILSLGLILVGGFLIGLLFERFKIPKIVGMILLGILLGPSVLNFIDPIMLTISPYLRQIALVIILTRSGLSLNLKNLKEIGRPAILMCFVPATFEIIGVLIFAPILLGVNIFEALLIGAVLGAVSPAIVVPRMIKLQNEKYGEKHHIPELVMAGASMDDIYVIVLFYSFLGLTGGGTINAWIIAQIPISIILGTVLGIIVGFVISFIFKKIKVPLVVKIIILLGLSFLMIGLEEILKSYISISSLIGIMVTGIIIFLKNKEDAKKIEHGYKNLWSVFEILLFVLVGISVDIKYAFSSGFMPLVVLAIALVFRMIGVFASLLFTKLTLKERLFVMFSYLPKATVQASIGGIALSMGLDCGPLVLTIAVLSILITAPLGAILMDTTYKKLIPKLEIEDLEQQNLV